MCWGFTMSLWNKRNRSGFVINEGKGKQAYIRDQLFSRPPSRSVLYSLQFACLFADQRGSSSLDLNDLLAGLLVGARDRLSRFWSTPEAFEEFLEEHCDKALPYVLRWIELHESLQAGKRKQFIEGLKDTPAELKSIFWAAGEFSETRGKASGCEKCKITAEELLFTLATNPSSVLVSVFKSSGLDLEKLGRFVLGKT